LAKPRRVWLKFGYRTSAEERQPIQNQFLIVALSIGRGCQDRQGPDGCGLTRLVKVTTKSPLGRRGWIGEAKTGVAQVRVTELQQNNANQFKINSSLWPSPLGEGGLAKPRRVWLKLGLQNFSGRTPTNSKSIPHCSPLHWERVSGPPRS
jgi:hypothetical protein